MLVLLVHTTNGISTGHQPNQGQQNNADSRGFVKYHIGEQPPQRTMDNERVFLLVEWSLWIFSLLVKFIHFCSKRKVDG